MSGLTPRGPATTDRVAEPTEDLACLVSGALSGDDARSEQLFARVHRIALSYARARLGTYPAAAEAAADVAQEVCIAVMAALPGYAERGLPFEAFVYRVAANKVADAQRCWHRGPVAVEPFDTDVLDAPTVSTEATVVARDEAGRAWALLEDFPERLREVLVLRVAVGLSTKETGEALGMTSGAVRVAHHRGLRELRSRWGREAS